MEGQPRDEQLRELKALRAEILSLKEKIKDGESFDEMSKALVASIMNKYMSSKNNQ